ncbi:MAG: hypothetical protein H7A25_22385 [Leptospiraceae bacterium]|nr:hypothetical protein [Leptospiraceae bacterium]MCP5502663.1 hypothetical protein [Leptospiraceae bacterium]
MTDDLQEIQNKQAFDEEMKQIIGNWKSPNYKLLSEKYGYSEEYCRLMYLSFKQKRNYEFASEPKQTFRFPVETILGLQKIGNSYEQIINILNLKCSIYTLKKYMYNLKKGVKR